MALAERHVQPLLGHRRQVRTIQDGLEPAAQKVELPVEGDVPEPPHVAALPVVRRLDPVIPELHARARASVTICSAALRFPQPRVSVFLDGSRSLYRWKKCSISSRS